MVSENARFYGVLAFLCLLAGALALAHDLVGPGILLLGTAGALVLLSLPRR
jgi:hypothetical protein